MIKARNMALANTGGRNPDFHSPYWSFDACTPWTSSHLRKAKSKEYRFSLLYSWDNPKNIWGLAFFFLNLSSEMNDPFSPRNSNYTLVSFSLVSYLNCSVRGKTIKPPLSDKEKDSQAGPVSCSRSRWVTCTVAGQAPWLRSPTLPWAHAKGALN